MFSEFANDFSERVQAGIVAFISSRKFQMQPKSPSWFNVDCPAAISHRNRLYHCFQRVSLTILRYFRRASSQCKSHCWGKHYLHNKYQNRLALQALSSHNFALLKTVSSSWKSTILLFLIIMELLLHLRRKLIFLLTSLPSNSTLDDSHTILPYFPSKIDFLIQSLLHLDWFQGWLCWVLTLLRLLA